MAEVAQLDFGGSTQKLRWLEPEAGPLKGHPWEIPFAVASLGIMETGPLCSGTIGVLDEDWPTRQKASSGLCWSWYALVYFGSTV